MEPYWTYEDIGIYSFVLVLLAALVRIAVRAHWLTPSQLAIPCLALETFIITFLLVALYLILRWRHPGPVVARLGWVVPENLHSAVGLLGLGGTAAALGIAFVMHVRSDVMPTIPTIDFLVLGLFLGSHFRGVCLPRMLASRSGPHLGRCRIGRGYGRAILGVSCSGRPDALDLLCRHWCRLGMASFGLSDRYRRLMHATCNLTLFLVSKVF